MCEKNKDLRVITSNIKNPDESKSFLIVPENKLQIYFSVDVCNSTMMKRSHEDWYEVNKILYNEPFSPMKFWKYNGDEVLYSERFHNIDNLISIIEDAYVYLKNMQKEIQNKIKNERIKIQLKGTLWIARISEEFSWNSNIHIRNNLSDEFLGYNIDEGFRLGHKITGSKIIIDPKIICILLTLLNIADTDIVNTLVEEESKIISFVKKLNHETIKNINKIINRLHFIDYTHLKGIWEERKYPVFWYYCDDIDFSYDEKIDNKYIEQTKSVETRKWYTEFENIFNNVGISREFNKIMELVTCEEQENIYSLESFSRLYYTVACINPSSGNIFIARRSKERKHLKGIWEFIPFKHTCTEIVQSIQKCFFDRFGCKITLLTDNELEQNVIPLHFCTIYRNGQAHNNLLCIATFNDQKTDDEIIQIIKHHHDIDKYYSDFCFVNSKTIEKYKSITLKEIEKDSYRSISDDVVVYDNEQAMMYFKQSILAVENYYKTISSGTNWYNVFGFMKGVSDDG